MQPSDNSRPQQAAESERLIAAWEHVINTLGRPPSVSCTTQESEVDLAKIPVLVLSGFLGAGKTTLLCRILEEGPGNVLAIVNDVASVNIDAELVKSRSANTMQLTNGCACCVLGDDLDEILSDIHRRPVVPDAIILEASGISDPISLAQTISRNDAMILDAIITVVDPTSQPHLFSDRLVAPILRRQLDAAHIIAISKTTTETDLTILLADFRHLAPGRPVIALNECLNISEILLGSRLKGARPEPSKQPHIYDDFKSTVIEWSAPINTDSLFQLLEHIPESVYRIKGWLTAWENKGYVRYLLQAAGPRWRIEADRGECASKVVIIGDNGSEPYNQFCDQMRLLVEES